MRFSGTLAVIVAVSVATGPVWASDVNDVNAKTEAKARFVAGQSHYNLNEFAEALGEFKEAYRLLPDPVFLYNLGQCERQLGHFEEAIRFYRSFLREQPKAPNRQDVLHKIDEMEAALKNKPAEPGASLRPSVAVTAPPGAPAEQAAPSPTSNAAALPAETAPVAPAVEASMGTPAQASASTARQDLVAAPALPRAAEPPRWYQHWWVWAGTAALAVGAGVAVVAATSGKGATPPGSTLGTKAVF